MNRRRRQTQIRTQFMFESRADRRTAARYTPPVPAPVLITRSNCPNTRPGCVVFTRLLLRNYI